MNRIHSTGRRFRHDSAPPLRGLDEAQNEDISPPLIRAPSALLRMQPGFMSKSSGHLNAMRRRSCRAMVGTERSRGTTCKGRDVPRLRNIP